MIKGKARPDKRQQIIAAADDLFRRAHDIRKVSLEAIARKARVSPTTIYNLFGNRETLLYEVIKMLAKQNLERNRAIVHSEIPFPQKLTGIIGGKLDLASQVNGELINKMLSQDEAIAPFVEEIYEKEIKTLWKEIIVDGKRQGYIDPSLDDAVLLVYLDVMKAGFSARPELLQNFTKKMGLIEQLARIFYYGFLKKDVDLFQKGVNHG